MTIVSDLQRIFKNGDILNKILLLNGGAFLLLWTIEIIGAISHSALYVWMLENISAPTALFAFLKKPWTLLTFMFFDTKFLSLFCNMLILWWTGRIFLNLMDEKRLLATYILGGLSGLLFALLATSAGNGLGGSILGPSAAILAVMTAIATYAPNYKIYLLFFGEVSLKYLVIIIVVIECLPLVSIVGNASSHAMVSNTINHIGGIAYGFAWASLLKKGTDISQWFLKLIAALENGSKKDTSRIKVHSRRKKDESYVSYEEVSRDEEEIDRILAKISKSGYDSLSKSEKETLFKQSKK